ncbi:MAG: hypothetical protein KKC76_11050 [Proteobacteria bacterium]|nr:hypothetical protein [Pseudomonadota bacterium]MBU4296099.1 hypothetical protein [Pseudomonadota bacterium]MCG2746983.1 hypothetical protein [Desulfobulbaceae bacterium]
MADENEGISCRHKTVAAIFVAVPVCSGGLQTGHYPHNMRKVRQFGGTKTKVDLGGEVKGVALQFSYAF